MTSPARRLVQNVGWLALSPLLRVLVGIPLAGLVAHRLGVAGYGELNLALAFAALFGVAANVGLNETFLRAAAQDAAAGARAWPSVLATKLGLLAAYLAALALLALALGHSGRMVALVVLMGVCTGGLSLENTSLALFSARQRMKPVAAVGAVKFVTEVAVTVAVLLAGATALGLTVSRAIVTGLAVLAGIVLARRLLGARLAVPSAAAVRPLLVAGLSFAAITTLWPIQARAGVLMLGHVHGLEAVALFSAAMLPVERLFSFFPAIQDACFPLFSALGRDDTARFPSALAKSLRYQALLAAGLGLGVSLAGPWALRVVFPPGLHAAGAVLEILGLAVGLRALGVLLTTATLARGLERAVVKATALQCAVTVAAAAALVGPLGAVGLGWATVVCEATGVGALAWVLWRRGLIGARPLASLAAPAAAGVALFLGFTQVPSGRDGLLVPLAFAASYPVVLVLSRALSRDDLGYVRALLAGQGRARSS